MMNAECRMRNDESLLSSLIIHHSHSVISLVGAGGKTTLMFSLARLISESKEPVLTTTTTKIYFPTNDQSPHVIVADSSDKVIDLAEKKLKDTFHVSAGRMRSGEKLIGFLPETIDSLWKSGIFRWILAEADGAAGRPIKAPADHEPVIPECTNIVIGVVGLDCAGKPLTDKWVFRQEQFAAVTGMSLGEPISAESIAKIIAHKKGIFKGAPKHAVKIAFLNKADQAGANIGQMTTEALSKMPENPASRIIIGSAMDLRFTI